MTRWPPIPKTVRGAGGPIRVKLAKEVRVDGAECYGSWGDDTRIILIESGGSREHHWRTLFHEWTHAALADSGLYHLLTAEMQESVCDAIATARIAEMRR